MPTYEDAAADAAEAQQALRGLARASRTMTDPGDAYRVVGSLAWGMAAIHQTLGQLIAMYEGPARETATIEGDPVAGRSSTTRIAAVLWEVRQSVELAGRDLDLAHQIEGKITHTPKAERDLAPLAPGATHRELGASDSGLSR
jgi:hypothetical protein